MKLPSSASVVFKKTIFDEAKNGMPTKNDEPKNLRRLIMLILYFDNLIQVFPFEKNKVCKRRENYTSES